MQTSEARVDGAVLTIGVPDGFVATPGQDGFVVRPNDHAERRSIYEITVTLGRARAAATPLTETRRIGGRTATYRIDREEGGGSGGDEVTLIAELPCPSRVIRVRLDTQAQNGGEPDLEPVWAVLEGAGCRPGG